MTQKLFLPTIKGVSFAEGLYRVIQQHKQQGRAEMVVDPILTRVAEQRAKDLAVRDYFSHTDMEGHGPNWHVRQAGYHLPDSYDQYDTANNVESLDAGQTSAEMALDGWLHSKSHKEHVLGLNDFFAEQTHVGIGYYSRAGSFYTRYWVFISAPKEESNA